MSTTCKTYAIPGGKGDPGPAGTNGTNGVNAFTSVTTGFAMPLEGFTVVAAVADSRWASIGQLVFVSSCGTMQVTGKPTDTSLTLLNVENSGSGLYPGNITPGTSVASGNTVSPAGQQGPSGAAAAGGLLAANNLSDVVNVATARSNLGLGSAAQSPSSDFLLRTSNLADLPSPSTARANLGLDDMAEQNSNSVAINGGFADNMTIVRSADVHVTSLLYLQGKVSSSVLPQTLNAGDAIQVEGFVLEITGNGAPVTLTSVPSIESSTTSDTLVIIRGGSMINTVTLSSDSTLSGSQLFLATPTRTITAKTTLVLLNSFALGGWQEVSFTTVL